MQSQILEEMGDYTQTNAIASVLCELAYDQLKIDEAIVANMPHVGHA